MDDTDACSETTNQNKSADQSDEGTATPAAENSSHAAESQSDKLDPDQNKQTDVNGSDSRVASSEIPVTKDDGNINEADNGQSSGPVTSPPPKLQIKLPSPSDKIKILLKPAGATPALTRDKWNVTRDKTIGAITNFVKKPLKMEAHQTLFMYVKQTFSPSADVEVGKLYDCFGSDGQLVLHFCMTEAWG